MTAPATWIPGDDELDGLARTLPSPERDAARVEDARTAVLAAAAGARQLPPRSTKPFFIIGGAALAAAAALIIWLAARPAESPAQRKENIAAVGVARFHTISDWPSYVVQLEDGQIAVEVASLDSGEHFVVAAPDAEIEVRGTKFVVGAAGGKLASLSVTEGRVELRRPNEPVVILAAGQTWKPTITAVRDELVEQPKPAVVESPTANPSPVVIAKRPSPSKQKMPATSSTPAVTVRIADTAAPMPTPPAPPAPPAPQAPPAPSAPQVTTPPPLAARPGELDFKNGVAALRAGDANAATKSFAAACSAARGQALDEDACFWVGAAARRAGQTATARSALAAFLQRFPSSARVGEAAALLGWILYDAGDLSAAEAQFRMAANDRVPKVKESAERGLASIERKRAQ